MRGRKDMETHKIFLPRYCVFFTHRVTTSPLSISSSIVVKFFNYWTIDYQLPADVLPANGQCH